MNQRETDGPPRVIQRSSEANQIYQKSSQGQLKYLIENKQINDVRVAYHASMAFFRDETFTKLALFY